jgi:AAHS family 4-hydroxybenzoate transporter-like MFS transporter
MATKSIGLTEVFDRTSITLYQLRVYILCVCVTLLDGFDMMVIGVALPKISEFLHASPSALGLAVGAGQVGPLAGAMGLGMLADRIGRRRMLMISAFIFGIFTLLTTRVGTVSQLALCRFCSGLGLGGAIPNALALGCEYAPNRSRASFTMLMWSGMPVGSVLAGLVAAWLLPHHGWQSLFWVGGVPPLLVATAVALFLPESLAFLVRAGADQNRIRRIVSRVAPGLGQDPQTQFYAAEEQLPGVPVKHLFLKGRAFTTLALWALSLLSFYLMWVMLSWSPTLLRRSGASDTQASMAFAYLNLGSVVATLIIGRLMDRLNAFRLLSVAFLFSFITVSIFGAMANRPFGTVAVLAMVTGLFIFGSNSGLIALATISYPVSIRSSGVGWAYGLGKIGSMFGPAVGGFLLARNWSVGRLCTVNGISGLVAAVGVLILEWHLKAKRRSDFAQVAGASG